MSVRHRLVVCTSCRERGEERGARNGVAGTRLFSSLSNRLESWCRRRSFEVVSHECLSACTRPCVIALRAPGKFTYVFGDMAPLRSELVIVETAALYAEAPTGYLDRDARPAPMRGAILARVPPFGE